MGGIFMATIVQKPNHLYETKKGEEIIYLGKASQLRLPDAWWSYPVSHIYIKVKDITRLGLSLTSNCETILKACVEIKSATPHLYFSGKTRPVIIDKGIAFPELEKCYDDGAFVLDLPSDCYIQLSFIDNR